MANETVGISFGISGNSISSQLKDQGFKFASDKVKEFQEDSDCINKLWFSGILTHSMEVKCRKKLFNRIKAHLKLKNPQP